MLKKFALAAAVMAGPVLADNVTIDTYLDQTKVPVNPKTWAVFDVAAADTLNALGVKPAGTVAKVYVDYLDEFKADAATVGTLFEPDYEALAALGPDLIIAGGRSSEAVPQMARIAPTIDMTVWEDTIGQAQDRLEAYGKIFQKEAEAAALKEKFNAKLDAAKAAMANKGTALMVMTNGPKISAYGSSGRYGYLFDALGLEEAVENVEEATHGEAISFEFIREANPDILIVLDRLTAIGRDGQNAQVTLDNALVRETNAWKKGNVVYLDGARVYIAGGGITALMHTFDQFAEAFGG